MIRGSVRMLAASVLLSSFIFAAESQAQYFMPYYGGANGRLSLDLFMSQYRLDARQSSESKEVDGYGGRVMWSLAPRPEPGRSMSPERPSLAARTAVGGFVVVTPNEYTNVATWHYGAQADVRPFATLLAGRFEPLLSLGAGAFRMEEHRLRPARPLCLHATDVPELSSAEPLCTIVPPSSVGRNSTTSFALSPAVGARLSVTPRLGFRGDLRNVMVFRGGTKHNVELSAGLSLTI